MTAPLFLADPATVGGGVGGGVVEIGGEEGRHAADVRRLRPGEPVLIGDGCGVVLSGTVEQAGRGRLTVRVAERREVAPPQPRFVVVQAVAKGGRDTDAVEAMTEVGVDAVWGWEASRSVARWTDRTPAKWAAAARAAAKQSRRAWVPAVEGPLTTAQVAARLRAAALAVVLHEAAPAPLVEVTAALPAAGDVVVVVGPEGGIADDELAVLAAAGAGAYRLGDAVLRTSTAGVAALSVLSAAARWR